MAKKLAYKFPGILLAIALLALMVVPVMAANEFEVTGANVYEGYLEDGDWLIVIEYQNALNPYYLNETSRDAFQLRLELVNGSVIAQTPLPAWGHKPGSIYLSAASVASLEWGLNYTIVMNGTANETDYNLTAADWRGDNLVILDYWCLALAARMESYYSTTFLVPSASVTTEVLNSNGTVLFIVGIPHLDQIRPGIFQTPTTAPEWETTNWTGAYETSLPTWNVAVGDNLATIFNSTGAAMGLEGIHIAGIILAFGYFGLAFLLGRGHALQGLVMASPILIGGFYFRIIPMAVLFVAIAMVAIFLVRQLWWKST